MSGRGSGRGRGRGGADDGGSRGRGGGGGFRGRGRGGGFGPVDIFKPDEGTAPPSPEVTKAENALVESNKGLSLQKLSLSSGVSLPWRPGYGTMGQKIVLRVNWFHLLPKPTQALYRYSIEIQPEEPIKRKQHRIFALLLEDATFASVRESVATDYRSNLVSAKDIDLGAEGRKVIRITYRESDGEILPNARTYSIKIQKSRTITLSELMEYLNSTSADARYEGHDEAVQALNIVMARKPSMTPNVVAVGQNKWFPVGPQAVLSNLGGGLIALKGYYASVRTATLRMMVNLNVCTGAFYKPGSLLVCMREFRDWDRTEDALGKFLNNLRVEINYLKKKGKPSPRVKTICGLALNGATAQQFKFQCEELGGMVSVENFFLRISTSLSLHFPQSPLPSVSTSLSLHFPQFPLPSDSTATCLRQLKSNFMKEHKIKLDVPQAPLVNVGTKEKPVVIPPELCTILPGQVARKQLIGNQSQEMLRVACRRPAENARLIVGEGAALVGMVQGNQNPLAAFGLRVEAKMLTVDGRILAAPTVKYKNGTAPTARGSWNMINKTFAAPAAIRNWSFLRLRFSSGDRFQGVIPDLIKTFKGALGAVGLQADNPSPPNGFTAIVDDKIANRFESDKETRKSIDAKLGEIQKKGVTMLLVILPTERPFIYASVKYSADTRYGIHTVCVVDQKLARETRQDQYMANVALKFNLKKGGVNQILPDDKLGILQKGKTMVVGIDVTHPSPDSVKGAPSIVGVVASVDNKLGQWPASIRVQEGRKEMVSELTDMVVERLKTWRKKNKDALPEQVLVYRDGVSEGQYESVLRDELPSFYKAFERVYPAKGPKPKIAIIIVGKRHHTRFYPIKEEDADQGGNTKNGTVVDRGITKHWEFFLQAHTGLQGTVRPAHYVVVRDEIGLGVDGLEQLTHNLCYLFGRATKSVSICPPAYYADLLCERGRQYLHTTMSGDGGAGQAFDISRAEWTRGVHPALEESMFYI